jgi:hypothetical protein
MSDIVKARIAQKQLAKDERAGAVENWKAQKPDMKILAHGDSWFSYLWILGTGGSVIDHLQKMISIPILNIAHAGDSTETMLGLNKRRQLEEHLPGTDVLLFSGGGNDIAGDQFVLWLNDSSWCMGDVNQAIDTARLNAVLDLIVETYRDLIEIRDRLAPDCLIVTHAYDFPIPSEHGVCGLGPWLKPGLDYCGWTKPADQKFIAALVMSQFHARLQRLAADETALGKKHVHIATLGTVSEDDWANEIHLNRHGLDKIAAKFCACIPSA